jgi:preprotein translocase subunit SecD
MARKTYRPGRTLVMFFLGVVLAYILVALTGTWKPELGLDLQGGTRIQLQAVGNPSSESLDEARAIIDQRVNGSGVAEAEVTTQGNEFVVVEIPGQNRRDLVETVQRQAQLRFRLVACSDANPTPCSSQSAADPNANPGPTDQPGTPAEQPGAGVTAPAAPSASAKPKQPKQPKASGSAPATANRPPLGFADQTGTPTPSPPSTATPSGSASPTGSASATDPSGDPSGSATDAPTEVPDSQGSADVAEELKWQDNPTGPQVQQFNETSCTPDGVLVDADGTPVPVVDDPNKPLVTCSAPEVAAGDEPATPSSKYLLSKAVIEGTELDSASAGIPQGQFNWVVSLKIGGEGKDAFTKISRELLCPGGGPECQTFAIVLDGQVISAPYMEGLISNGEAQISGNFTEATATSLATSLKFGALPISFSDEAQIETIGPSLAGNQLQAGITAGLIGLALVMLYCLVYYRGLGLVVIASLLVAAAVTYAMVLLLSEAANFTLTLPGIAGLIVAVGITADSFIVFFERIRDEMRDGKSMRVAVESGWVRARNTCLAADTVSLLAAVVLFIFAVGVVKGFAFALGLSTLIDLVVFFWFTKPMVSWLARFKFFNRGHRMSGLDADALGVDSINLGAPVPAGARGGKA